MTPEDRDVLDWVNEQRAERGLPPRRRLLGGVRGWCADCPVARSLSEPTRPTAVVGPWEWWWWWEGRTRPLPSRVRALVRAFDAGKRPDLELKR
jgi:hypothetical protein